MSLSFDPKFKMFAGFGFGDSGSVRVGKIGSVGVMSVSGVLGSGWGSVSYDAVVGAFAALVDDLGVEAVVVEWDSPGGEVARMIPAAERLRALSELRDIPVYCHATECCSAAYIIASAMVTKGGQITADIAARVGQMGVRTGVVSREKMLRDAGFDIRLIGAGEHKNDGMPELPIDEAVVARLQSQTNEIYEALCVSVGADLARRRGISPDEGARMLRAQQSLSYIGNQEAIDAGVIDAVASLDQTIEMALGAVTVGA